MASLLLTLGRAGRDRRGVAAAEYAIMAVGIVIVVGSALMTLLDPSTSAFVAIGNAVSSTVNSMNDGLATSR